MRSGICPYCTIGLVTCRTVHYTRDMLSYEWFIQLRTLGKNKTFRNSNNPHSLCVSMGNNNSNQNCVRLHSAKKKIDMFSWHWLAGWWVWRVQSVNDHLTAGQRQFMSFIARSRIPYRRPAWDPSASALCRILQWAFMMCRDLFVDDPMHQQHEMELHIFETSECAWHETINCHSSSERCRVGASFVSV